MEKLLFTLLLILAGVAPCMGAAREGSGVHDAEDADRELPRIVITGTGKTSMAAKFAECLGSRKQTLSATFQQKLSDTDLEYDKDVCEFFANKAVEFEYSTDSVRDVQVISFVIDQLVEYLSKQINKKITTEMVEAALEVFNEENL